MEAYDEAQRLKELGQDLFRAGELEEAAETFAQARQGFAESADRDAEGEMLNNLGVVQLRLDALEEAEAHLRQARSIFEETGNQSGLGVVFCHQGMLMAAQDRPEEATELFQLSIDLLEDVGELDHAKLVRREMRKVTGEGFPMGVTRSLVRLLGRLTGASAEDEEAEAPPEVEQSE
jgi:tetratricopeptide (TPR) repeat protein